MIDFDILLFFAEKHQQQKQTAVFLQAALYADHFGISLNVQNMSGVERLPWKKHVFFLPSTFFNFLSCRFYGN